MTREDIKTITDIVHKTIYGFFDVCDDDEETPMTDKDKLLLKVNKAICNNIKALDQETCEDWYELPSDEMTLEQARQAVKDLREKLAEHFDETVSLGAFKQVMWERNIAIGQLKELGYDFGQKIEPCGDAISRQAVDTLVDELARVISDERCCISRGRSTATIMQDILDLPPVTADQRRGHCRECRWWKDSDGAYRRGVRAESQCPINRKEVYEGNGYCYMFEPKESEE